jgi:two-component system, chemotaxis family, response regulator Rcp1
MLRILRWRLASVVGIQDYTISLSVAPLTRSQLLKENSIHTEIILAPVPVSVHTVRIGKRYATDECVGYSFPTESLGSMSHLSQHSHQSQVSRPKQLEVLVVQSNPADTLLTIEAFRVAGLTSGLHCVTDGEDALMYVRREGKYANEAILDLIFLDLSQPQISGLEVLRVVKSTPSLMHIPIMVAAGADDPEFVLKVYKLNGNCFMQKPEGLAQFAKFIKVCYEFWGSVVTLSSHRAENN